jgi:RNA polymerase sigma factor (sigma-70 family)
MKMPKTSFLKLFSEPMKISIIASRLHRKKARRLKFRGIFSQEQADNIIDRSSNPEEKLEVTLLLEAMQKLPPAQHEALALFEISGLSLKEIQEIQQCNLSAVKARISRARQKLAQILHVKELDIPVKMDNAGTSIADKLKTLTVNFL